jgi:hypothetical protein
MGFFGGDNNQPSRGEELATEQINMDKQEIAAKKQNLFQQRLDIIKGQGAQIWEPNKRR